MQLILLQYCTHIILEIICEKVEILHLAEAVFLFLVDYYQ